MYKIYVIYLISNKWNYYKKKIKNVLKLGQFENESIIKSYSILLYI